VKNAIALSAEIVAGLLTVAFTFGLAFGIAHFGGWVKMSRPLLCSLAVIWLAFTVTAGFSAAKISRRYPWAALAIPALAFNAFWVWLTTGLALSAGAAVALLRKSK